MVRKGRIADNVSAFAYDRDRILRLPASIKFGIGILRIRIWDFLSVVINPLYTRRSIVARVIHITTDRVVLEIGF